MKKLASLSPSKRAFSLIEAAIVLAIVGLVIGALWIAAAQAIENHKINEIVTGVYSTRERVNQIFTRAAAAGANDNLYCNINPYPASWPCNYVYAKIPLGMTMNGTTGGNRMSVAMALPYPETIPVSQCVKITSQLLRSATDDTTYVMVNTITQILRKSTATPALIKTYCANIPYGYMSAISISFEIYGTS